MQFSAIFVPDKRSRILEVVVVRRIFNLGTGNLEWGGNGKGLRKGRSVYEQPETKVDGSCQSKEGFQVSKGDKEEGKGESVRGVKKSKGTAPYIL
jgi:hypothetical protein